MYMVSGVYLALLINTNCMANVTVYNFSNMNPAVYHYICIPIHKITIESLNMSLAA